MRRFALALLPIVLLAVACGGSSKTSTKTSTPKATPLATRALATATPNVTQTPISTPGVSSGGNDAASALFDSVNPLQLLDNLSGEPTPADVDPKLKAALLKQGDLPNGFVSMGEFGYEVPSPYGAMPIAANIFSSGDQSSDKFGGMVMSAAIELSPQAIGQINAHGGIGNAQNLSDADLQNLTGAVKDFGVSLADVRILDGSGLGDGGVGMHMVIDFSALMQAFGAATAEDPLGGGLAIDIYMFLRGDHMLMLMSMSPSDQSSGVDARALADKLDANAAGVF